MDELEDSKDGACLIRISFQFSDILEDVNFCLYSVFLFKTGTDPVFT